MKFLRQFSNRLNNSGRSFVDYYLCWEYKGHKYAVRIEPSFSSDYSKFYAIAEEVPQGEDINKYL